MVQYDIEVRGRVQGVGFRQFTLTKAKQLDIKGWVRNTHDGKVRAVAQGTEQDVNTFIDYLRTGPSMARVEGLSKYKMQEPGVFSDFRVKS